MQKYKITFCDYLFNCFREDNLSKTGFIIREGLHHALSSLLKVHPELGIKNILDELESLESNKADGEKSKKDNKSNDTLKTSASQSDNECLKVEAGSDTLCNPSDLSRYSFGQGLLNFDPSSSKTPESPHQGRAHSSKRSRKDLPKRTSYDKFYSEKYGYSSCSKYENRHGDLKDYLYQRSRSSRSSLKESRRSKRRKSYSRSRSRSRSPSKRKSFKKERSRKKSDKEKKREKFLRHFSSEYHSEYDDLYKSYQHKVDTISCKEREDFDAAKNCKPLPTLNSTHEVNFTGLSETAIQELKDSQKILQMIDKKLA